MDRQPVLRRRLSQVLPRPTIDVDLPVGRGQRREIVEALDPGQAVSPGDATAEPEESGLSGYATRICDRILNIKCRPASKWPAAGITLGRIQRRKASPR